MNKDSSYKNSIAILLQLHYNLSKKYLKPTLWYNIITEASQGLSFLFELNPSIYFITFFRVRLSKRRVKQGHRPNNSRLVVTHRPLNAQEHRTQVYREKMLQPPCEEDEEEEEEEEEEELPVGNEGNNKKHLFQYLRGTNHSGS